MDSFKAAFFQNGLKYSRVYSAIRNAGVMGSQAVDTGSGGARSLAVSPRACSAQAFNFLWPNFFERGCSALVPIYL